MKRIILAVPLLMGETYEPAGAVLDVDDRRARALVEAGHARPFEPTDAHGSGTIQPPAPAPAPRAVETASRSVAGRKAVQLAGKAV